MDELLTRSIANIIPNTQELENFLKSKSAKIYLGIDPTSTRIHLGHAVALRKLQAFKNAGHQIIFLIGDFTALIGDTSDKDTERPILTTEQIESNFHNYQTQASKILNFDNVQVVNNRTWLSQLNFEQIVKLCQNFSAGDFYSRELIKTRLEAGKRVGLHEVLYSVMQGYDFYHLDADIQIGGTDQTFNMQAGRTLQKNLRNKDCFVISTPFLTGTDGRKMSKSWGNAIWLDDEPNEIFGKIMSLKDELIIEYFTLATNTPMTQIVEFEKQLKSGINPIEIKKTLAHTIVSELHDHQSANQAQEYFYSTIQQGVIPTNIPELIVSSLELTPLNILIQSNICQTNGEAKRLIEQGGFTINDQKITDPFATITLNNGDILKAGKRNYAKIILI